MEVQELQGMRRNAIFHPNDRRRRDENEEQSQADSADTECAQRESSATIKAAPAPYEQSEPAKPKNILEFDCRGLEFTEFKPEV